MEEQLVSEEPVTNPIEVMTMNLKQEAMRMLQNGDFFIGMTAKSEEAKEAALSVKEAMGNYGAIVFHMNDIDVDPEAEDLLTYVAFSMLEGQFMLSTDPTALGLLHNFRSYLDTELGPTQFASQMVALPAGDKEVSVLPFRVTIGDFRQWLGQALVAKWLDRPRSRVMTLPNLRG